MICPRCGVFIVLYEHFFPKSVYSSCDKPWQNSCTPLNVASLRSLSRSAPRSPSRSVSDSPSLLSPHFVFLFFSRVLLSGYSSRPPSLFPTAFPIPTFYFIFQAFRFENTAKRLKNTLFWKRVRFYSAAFLGTLILLYAITAVACGPTYTKCKSTWRSELCGVTLACLVLPVRLCPLSFCFFVTLVWRLRGQVHFFSGKFQMRGLTLAGWVGFVLFFIFLPFFMGECKEAGCIFCF